MIKRLILMLVFVGVLFALIFGFGAFRSYEIGKYFATLSNPPQTVATMPAVETPWQSSISAVGSVVAINGANISAEVAGIVDTIKFESGTDVAAGTVLATLRPNNDDAVLAQLQATASLDKITYDRDVQQLAADAISRSQLDTDKANLQSATAQVQAQQALMAEKVIKAPFAGRLGIRDVDIGQYLTAGTQIVTLQQLNPLFVDFYLPQQALAQISVGQTVDVSIDAYPDKNFPGKITSINASLDTGTRTIKVRATIQNDDLLLRPGMFATVNIAIGQPQNLVTLPQTAISYNSYGNTIFTVVDGKDASGKATLTARQSFVTTGDTRGDQVAVLSGIKAGDQVVVAGALKLKNGSPVTINNSVLPTNNPNPTPPNE
jgi:membrane fusion protein (multidrug efflux system)